MNFQNSFTLKKMQSDAQDRFSRVSGKIDTVADTLKRRLGGKSRGALVGGFVISIVWAIAYCILYAVMREANHPLVTLVTLGTSVLLVVFAIIGNVVSLSYYGAILNAEAKLGKLRNRVESAKRSLSADMTNCMSRGASGWEMPLQPGSSVEEEVRKIESSLSGLEKVSGGFVNGVKNVLYYIATVGWTVAGSFLFYQLLLPLVEDEVSDKTANIVFYIAMLIACVGAVIVAKLIWGKTECSVKNLTLLGTLNGPVVFLALALIVILVVLAVKLIIAALGIIIAAIVAISCCCGG